MGGTFINKFQLLRLFKVSAINVTSILAIKFKTSWRKNMLYSNFILPRLVEMQIKLHWKKFIKPKLDKDAINSIYKFSSINNNLTPKKSDKWWKLPTTSSKLSKKTYKKTYKNKTKLFSKEKESENSNLMLVHFSLIFRKRL